MVETVDTLGGTDVDRCQQQWRGFCSLLQDACRRHWESSVSLFGAESPLAIWAEELCQSNLPPSFAKTLRSVRKCLVFSNEELTSQRLLSSLGKRAILVGLWVIAAEVHRVVPNILKLEARSRQSHAPSCGRPPCSACHQAPTILEMFSWRPRFCLQFG